jgi:D-inositol-3-phosphate glycosyltransferase
MYLYLVAQQDATSSTDGLAAALSALGHRVEHTSLPSDGVSAAAALGHELAAAWGAERPDVVVALGWLAGLSVQVGRRERPVPVVQRLFAPGRTGDVERRRLENAVARGADRVLALCSSDADRLVDLGVRRSSVRVVPHGVDTTTFGDDGPAWPGADGRRLVARPVDHDAAARLIGLLPQLPRCELVLLTSPATRSGVTSALTEVVDRNAVASRVRLIDSQADEHSPAALAALLRATDVVLAVDDQAPSLDLVLSGMATGVPVVAPAVGALADVVADGVTGVLVAPAAASGMADAVRALMSDDLSREAQGLAAGDRARASFGWPAVAAAVTRVAEEVTAASGSPRTAAAAS